MGVAETLRGEDLDLGAASGRFDAYFVQGETPRNPAVLLLPEMFGLSPAMRQAAEDFARAGHAALVPNVFWRAERPGTMGYEGVERQMATERLAAFDVDRAIDDLALAVTVLRERSRVPDIVAVGHCIGGRLAVLALSRLGLAGAASYYGLGLDRYGDELARLAKPAQLHYGLADPHVPAGEIAAVAAMVADNPHVAIYRYPDAGHSFVNPFRPMFDAAQAALVRERTFALLGRVARRDG